ncbi:MAG: prephenate dehydrogenase/arogenate dehydrogenase family protein [Acidimicrobiales bacterium]
MTSPSEAGEPADDLAPGAAGGSGDPTEPVGPGGSNQRRVQVVGTGLIGGSLGLALRSGGWFVTGSDKNPERADEALAGGALDAVGVDLGAQVVVVATPVSSVAEIARRILSDPGRPSDVVVTDVGGVKGTVVASIDHPRFVGGHPMAGSEQGGLSGADPELFTGASWVLTPSPGTDLAAFDRIRSLVTSLGADVVVLSPEDHDRLVAVVSHVPHLVAATLMNAAARDAEHDAALLRLAAGGFRDMTRVAAGHPGIWPDVCAENARAIVDALDHLLGDLSELRRYLSERDRSQILRFLADASVARRALPTRAFRPENLAELRIPVPDREGVLAELTAAAGGLGVNIYDIEIAHSAEGQRGVLLLVVAGAQAGPLRDAVLGAGYRCTIQALS